MVSEMFNSTTEHVYRTQNLWQIGIYCQ